MAMRLYKYWLVSAAALLLSFSSLNAQTVTFTQTNVTCNGGSDGTITLTLSGGTSSYRYVIYNAINTAESDSFGPTADLSHVFTGIDASIPNLYSVYVRDLVTDVILGFSTLQITEPGVLNATVNSTNVTCFGGSNGTITISAPPAVPAHTTIPSMADRRGRAPAVSADWPRVIMWCRCATGMPRDASSP